MFFTDLIFILNASSFNAKTITSRMRSKIRSLTLN